MSKTDEILPINRRDVVLVLGATAAAAVSAGFWHGAVPPGDQLMWDGSDAITWDGTDLIAI